MPEQISSEELIKRLRALENEVAQSREIEKQLQKSEELLRIYIANTLLSVVMCDKGMRWIAYSQQVIAKAKIVGLANNTILISKDGRETVLADSGAPIMDQVLDPRL